MGCVNCVHEYVCIAYLNQINDSSFRMEGTSSNFPKLQATRIDGLSHNNILIWHAIKWEGWLVLRIGYSALFATDGLNAESFSFQPCWFDVPFCFQNLLIIQIIGSISNNRFILSIIPCERTSESIFIQLIVDSSCS